MTDNAPLVAGLLMAAAEKYEPADDVEPIAVLHDIVLAMVDRYCDHVSVLRPTDRDLPALFRALDEAAGMRSPMRAQGGR